MIIAFIHLQAKVISELEKHRLMYSKAEEEKQYFMKQIEKLENLVSINNITTNNK